MNDEHEQDPQLGPHDEARIRALLADLGTGAGSGATSGASSMPPEVVARLDETVARLGAERSRAADEVPEQTHHNVVPLRRRWATRAATAAAAVIVVGAGGVAAANLGVFGSGGSQDNSSAGGSSAKAESLDSGKATTPSAPPGVAPGAVADGQVPALTAASFDTEVARLLGQPLDAADSRAQADSPTSEPKALGGLESGKSALRATACPGPSVTDGTQRVTVRYDGRYAALLVHPPSGGDRLVEAWSCSGGKKLDSARVPVVGQTSGQSPGNPGLGSPTSTP